MYLDFGINPHDFLAFAERDLAGEIETHSLVNCLTNAKRAIDSQVDRVLCALGVSVDHQAFGKKFEDLGRIGIVAPRIIQKVRKARNLLEHEYVCPARSEVEDALDIATLFVAAVDRVFLLFPLTVSVSDKDEPEDPVYIPHNCLQIQFTEDRRSFRVLALRHSEWAGNAEVGAGHQYFLPLVRLFIALQREVDVEGATAQIALMLPDA